MVTGSYRTEIGGMRMKAIGIIGAPSSAGAYAPGQEKAPAAMREAGFVQALNAAGRDSHDYGDVAPFRWTADRENPRAMNVEPAARAARAVANLVERSITENRLAIVLGGDCSVGLGTVAGVLSTDEKVGVLYADLDADLNTPETVSDGALDWMGVAHMLGLHGTVSKLASIASRNPMIEPENLMLFGTRNITASEQKQIDELEIKIVTADDVIDDPAKANRKALDWAGQFDRLVLDFDVDLIDFEDFPLSENVRRKEGLTFEQAMSAIATLLGAPNLAAFTIAEINPDHGREDGSTIREFSERMVHAITARQH